MDTFTVFKSSSGDHNMVGIQVLGGCALSEVECYMFKMPNAWDIHQCEK